MSLFFSKLADSCVRTCQDPCRSRYKGHPPRCGCWSFNEHCHLERTTTAGEMSTKTRVSPGGNSSVVDVLSDGASAAVDSVTKAVRNVASVFIGDDDDNPPVPLEPLIDPPITMSSVQKLGALCGVVKVWPPCMLHHRPCCDPIIGLTPQRCLTRRRLGTDRASSLSMPRGGGRRARGNFVKATRPPAALAHTQHHRAWRRSLRESRSTHASTSRSGWCCSDISCVTSPLSSSSRPSSTSSLRCGQWLPERLPPMRHTSRR